MTVVDKPSARETKRLQTRERLMGAAIAEFKRAGMADADVGAIVAAAGVAHGTFFFHFPTKEHVLLELEQREEQRIAKQLVRSTGSTRDLPATLDEAVRLVMGLERRLGAVLFKDFLALHFSQTRPSSDESRQHPVIVEVAREIEQAQKRGDVDPDVTPDEQRGVLPARPVRAADDDARLARPDRHDRRLRGEDASQHRPEVAD